MNRNLIIVAESKADGKTIHWLRTLIAKYGGTCDLLKHSPENKEFKILKEEYEKSLEYFIARSSLSGCPALRK